MTQSRLMWPATSAVYDQMHDDGWRWDDLTSSEAAAAAATIEPVIAAIAALGFEFVRTESARLSPQQQKGPIMEAPTTDALDRQVDAEVADTTLQVSKTAALNHASLVLIEAESAVDVMVSDSKIRIAQASLRRGSATSPISTTDPMKTQPPSSGNVGEGGPARRAAVLRTSLVTGYNDRGGVHWIDVIEVDTGQARSIAISHSDFAVGETVIVEILPAGRALVRAFSDDDITPADLVQCEGCPTLIDPRHCHYDVNGCALCDECHADLLSVP